MDKCRHFSQQVFGTKQRIKYEILENEEIMDIQKSKKKVSFAGLEWDTWKKILVKQSKKDADATRLFQSSTTEPITSELAKSSQKPLESARPNVYMEGNGEYFVIGGKRYVAKFVFEENVKAATKDVGTQYSQMDYLQLGEEYYV